MPKNFNLCPICKSKNVHLYRTIGKFSYYMCVSCKSLILYPKPTSRDLQFFYKKTFDYTNGEIEEKAIRKRSSSILNTFKVLNPSGRTVLDIGSGLGYFLDEARKKGYETFGIEPSQKLFYHSKNELKLDIQNVALEKFLRTNRKKYDFISLIHVIEHIENPSYCIQKILNFLKKDGILLIETPNLDSHLFSTEQKNYSYMSAPEHLWVFSKKSLIQYIISKPKDKITINTYSTSENFMGILKKILKRDKNIVSFKTKKKNASHKVMSSTSISASIKILLFDKLLAKILTPLLNLNDKGSIIQIYVNK